jgi:hypothetical protein
VFEQGQHSVASSPTPLRPPAPPKDEDDEFDEFQPRRRLRHPESLVGLWFGYITMAALFFWTLAFAVRAYAEYEVMNVFAGPMKGPARDPFQLLHAAEFWQMATSWIALPCFAIWLFLAARNARALHASGFSMSPGWVLAILCCPVLNGIFLYLNLQEIWRASDAAKIETMESWRSASPGALIRFWGLTVLCNVILTFWYGPRGRLGDSALCVANLTIAFSGGLLIAIIYFIQARQHERYVRLFEDPD